MFRIRRIFDDLLPINVEAIRQVQAILREQFDALRREEVDSLPVRLRNPVGERFRLSLSVAEDQNQVLGFALLLLDPKNSFCYLDYIAAGGGLTGRGIGGSLYGWVREEAKAMGARAIFFECLPDEGELPPGELAANRARLRFYERYGARPIINTAYATPVEAGSTSPQPYIVVDPLDNEQPLTRRFVRTAVRAILERKYAYLCPPEYIDMVARSIRDNPVRLRPPRYFRQPVPQPRVHPAAPIPIVVSRGHEIHHVRERGYVEAPVRVSRILQGLEPTGLFREVEPREFPRAILESVHDPELVAYLRRASAEAGDRPLYPYVFPIRNRTRQPKERSVLAGYYCIDTFTPIHRNSYTAAKRAVDCALTGAVQVLDGQRLVYALVRPPGHHAERECFGGFCYFNNAGVAAQYLSAHGRVAVLDLDYHHGNGQQSIFYQRDDVFTVSIHGSPSFAYPYFTGFEDECGEGPGEGYNLNIALPERRNGKQYRSALERALRAIADYRAAFLVVALGLDTGKGDPTGTWSLVGDDFAAVGERLGAVGLPTLVVQEGGYRTRTLGLNARRFFEGLASELLRP